MSAATLYAVETFMTDASMVSVGVVRVVNRRARCTCSWSGRRRAAVFLARHDAWMHAALHGCVPGEPLVSG